MRMWNVDSILLCQHHLLGEHLEMHMFAGCLIQGKSLEGYKSKGDDGGMDCEHPLRDYCNPEGDRWEGGDCWGFRPDWKLEDIAEYISQRMQGQFVDLPRRK